MQTRMFSILVPAYNAESTIEQALRSALAQTETNIEVLVVDDGSTDATEARVLALQREDSRIRYRYQENAGPGAARNTGLENCTGDYIIFLDADDWIEPDYLEQVSRLLDARPADVVVSGYVYDFYRQGKYVSSSRVVPEPTQKSGTREVIRWIPVLDEQRSFSYVWGKVYRAELIRNYGLRFGSSRFGEDYAFNLQFFEYVQQLCVVDCAWCHYQKINSMSLTSVSNRSYYPIGMERYALQRALLERYGCLDAEAQRQMANVHLKTLLAAIVRSRADSTPREHRRFLRQLLDDPANRQAMALSGGNGLAGQACALVLRSRSVLLAWLLGAAVGFSQQHLSGILRSLAGRRRSETNE